jgi:hypothetical protein
VNLCCSLSNRSSEGPGDISLLISRIPVSNQIMDAHDVSAMAPARQQQLLAEALDASGRLASSGAAASGPHRCRVRCRAPGAEPHATHAKDAQDAKRPAGFADDELARHHAGQHGGSASDRARSRAYRRYAGDACREAALAFDQ